MGVRPAPKTAVDTCDLVEAATIISKQIGSNTLIALERIDV